MFSADIKSCITGLSLHSVPFKGKLSLTVKVGPTSFHVAPILSVGEIPTHLLCNVFVSIRVNTGALLCT